MNPFVSPAETVAHRRALVTLHDAGLPVLVGGAYAMFQYTGMLRHTKDLDIFLRREDEAAARAALDDAGYRTDPLDPVWLSKAWWGDILIDLIFSSGNGVVGVDDEWISLAPRAEVLGVPARLVPPEEMVWSKAYVQERDRWDGADVAHLIRFCGRTMDWDRLLRRFEAHWEVLLAHLTLYSFSFPHDRDIVPRWVMRRLLGRASRLRPEQEMICRGTLLSRWQYAADIRLGYRDAREVEVPGFFSPAPAAQAEERAGVETSPGA